MAEWAVNTPPPDTISQEDLDDYMDVVQAALEIHFERERVRQGLWKDYEAKDQVNTIKIKADRIVRSFEIMNKNGSDVLHTEILNNVRDELLDIINYANFAVRQLKA